MKKRILSIIIALVMAFGGCLSICASAEGQKYNGNPVIVVRGMDFGGLIYNQGMEDEANCFAGIDVGEVVGALLKGLVIRTFTGSTQKFVASIVPCLENMMGKMACNPDGTTKYNVSVKEYPKSLANYDIEEVTCGRKNNEEGFLRSAVDKYGADNVYYFNYDWRLDPYVNAEKLDTMIDRATKETGKEKANIVCCSMGGILTVSYMYKYGWDKLSKVIFVSSTICGAHVPSDLLRGEIHINADNVYNYASSLMSSDQKALVNLIGVLDKTGVIKALAAILNRIIPNLKEPLYEQFLIDTFATMPALWALVLPEAYDEAIEYIFGGREEKYSKVIELSKQYQEMQAQRDEMLMRAQDDGVYIALLAGYNTAVIPVYEGGGGNGDSILESDRMLGCAKVAPLGETLGKDYKGERVSPDNIVDLSDALFPETTWAFRDAPHVPLHYNSDINAFVFTILEYDGRFTVTTDVNYPQFMKSDKSCTLLMFK